MSELLVIRLAEHETDTCEAVIVTDGAVGSSVHRGDLHALAQYASGRKVLAMIDGGSVLHTRAAVPVKGAARILQAIPFALEEQLAEDVSRLHFAIGKRDDEGQIPAAVVANERISEWLERLSQAGIQPGSVVTDLSMLPRHPGAAVAVIDGDAMLFACPNGDVLRDEPDNLELLIDVCGFAGSQAEADHQEDEADQPPLASTTAKPLERLVVYALNETLQALGDDLERIALRVEQIETREISQHPLRLLARGASAEPAPINLLQGSYAPKTALTTLWQPWRVAAGLLVGFIATALGAQAIQLLQLRAEEAVLDGRIATVLQGACPGNTAIVDPRVQMQRCIAARGGSAGQEVFLNMLGTVGSVVAETPNTKIDQISYRNRIMDLKVTAPSVESLDRIKKQVAERGGLEMVIESTSPSGSVVQSQIEIRKPSA